MYVNAVVKQNFVYRMVLKDVFWFYVTSASTHCSMYVCHMSLKDLLTDLLITLMYISEPREIWHC